MSSVTAGQDGSEDVVVTRARHREHLIECLGSIRSFLDHPAQARNERWQWLSPRLTCSSTCAG